MGLAPFLRGVLLCMLFVVQLPPRALHSLSACFPCGGGDGCRPCTHLFFRRCFVCGCACACWHASMYAPALVPRRRWTTPKASRIHAHGACVQRGGQGEGDEDKPTRMEEHAEESGGERGPCPFAAHSLSLSLSLCFLSPMSTLG